MNFFNPFRRPKKKPAPEHVHSLKPIAVKHGIMGGRWDQAGEPIRATEILMQCDCGEFNFACVQGHWTVEEAGAGQLSKDVAELKRMASL